MSKSSITIDIPTLTPREIVSELDRISSSASTTAKRAVAIALRNRWRRQQLPKDLREEVLPKNILMIGPTGVGKTEIARRLAKLAQAPFLKVEATKFTEVGYVGRDVESDHPRSGGNRHSHGARENAPFRHRTGRALCRGTVCWTRWSVIPPAPTYARIVPPETAQRRSERQGDRNRCAG
jgi:hypothetical protein